MKKSYQHIIKKSYTTPKIEEVEIDVAISLNDLSTKPPGDGNEDDEIDPTPPNPTSTAPKYPTEYRSESPFGGSTPIY